LEDGAGGFSLGLAEWADGVARVRGQVQLIRTPPGNLEWARVGTAATAKSLTGELAECTQGKGTEAGINWLPCLLRTAKQGQTAGANEAPNYLSVHSTIHLLHSVLPSLHTTANCCSRCSLKHALLSGTRNKQGGRLFARL
jgi:hypothetical protein